MIKITNLTKKFGTLTVIDNITLDIPESQTLAVIGPSGCGKSTLLKLILRLEAATSGKIIIDNQEISRLSEEQLIRLRRKLGMVFQSSALFDSMTVGENVAFALREHAHHSEREIKKIVADKLELVNLSGKEPLMPSELSGGMQKRVGIARALAFDPNIILYDEPTTGLDPITSTNIENLIIKLGRELKVTSIIVTHQLSTIFRTAQRIVLMNNGKLIEGGTVMETKGSKNPIIHEFITAGLENKGADAGK